MLRNIFVFLLSLAARINPEDHGVFLKIEKNSFLFGTSIIWNGTADSLLICSQMCARRDDCKSANFKASQGTCLLLSEGETRQLGKRLKREGSFYLEKVGSAEISSLPGTTKSSAVPSCQALHNKFPQASTGVYWINPDGGSQSNAFKANCDMETEGGGWTLVWSYTFTNYGFFSDTLNAITPRPMWPVDPSVGDVPISTTPPLNETDYNAINFSHWKQLGKQILIKRNIKNWLICDDGTGSLVDWQDGNITCHIPYHVTDTCYWAVPPTSLLVSKPYGPRFRSSHNYYYFDSSMGSNWPTHDPCGTNKANHVRNVANPHGNIFIR